MASSTCLLDIGERDRGDHVGGGVGERLDLGGVVTPGRLSRQQLGWVVAVVLRTHAAADHDGGRPVGLPFPNLLEQRDRLAVHLVELPGVVTDLGRPPRTGPPGRALEHEAQFRLACESHVGLVVGAELLGARFVLEHVEGREEGQIQALVEDQNSLDPAVGQEHAPVQLG
jgi:hypothetical protein